VFNTKVFMACLCGEGMSLLFSVEYNCPTVAGRYKLPGEQLAYVWEGGRWIQSKVPNLLKGLRAFDESIFVCHCAERSFAIDIDPLVSLRSAADG